MPWQQPLHIVGIDPVLRHLLRDGEVRIDLPTQRFLACAFFGFDRFGNLRIRDDVAAHALLMLPQFFLLLQLDLRRRDDLRPQACLI